MSIYRRAPRITNLLFADDSVILCQANQREVQEIVEILQVYAGASGQYINMEKSSVFFSGNAPMEHKH